MNKSNSLRWKSAIIYPDSEGSWDWAFRKIFFIPSIVRVLSELRKKGIKQVSCVGLSDTEINRLKDILEKVDNHKIPEVCFENFAFTGPVLLVSGGFLWHGSILTWFDKMLLSQHFGAIVLRESNCVVLASSDSTAIKDNPPVLADFQVSFRWPDDIFCKSVWEFSADDSEILELVGKPSDRPHVVLVRKLIFKFLRLCAKHGIHPNAITWTGFFIHFVGCVCIAFGGYLLGIWGSMLLILSWIVDCADGTLARLTLQESKSGQILDTRLGHLSNITFFAAILARCWSSYSLVEFFILALVLFGGITVAAKTHAEVAKLQTRLPRFFQKINHRDYTFIVFLFALFNILPAFLWLGIVGVYAFALAELYCLAN